MAEKVYYAETIEETTFPTTATSGTTTSTTEETSGEKTYTAQEISDTAFTKQVIARETVSQALNTKNKKILAEFEFGVSGAIQIGEYANGLSGDIKISPNGIVARNKDGDTTFALDGDTGDAVFKGTITTGTLVSGEVIVGNNNVIIDGTNQRIIINDGYTDRILIGYGQGLF